jgi:hypothetical protein
MSDDVPGCHIHCCCVQRLVCPLLALIAVAFDHAHRHRPPRHSARRCREIDRVSTFGAHSHSVSPMKPQTNDVDDEKKKAERLAQSLI